MPCVRMEGNFLARLSVIRVNGDGIVEVFQQSIPKAFVIVYWLFSIGRTGPLLKNNQ
jgi:hypothetical protein